MLGATLGVEVDMLMKRYSLTEMSRTVVLQACAAAMLEEYLNNWQKSLKEEMTHRDISCVRDLARDTVISVFYTKRIFSECWIVQRRSDLL